VSPPNACLAAALAYAGRGWAVIPLHHPTRFGPKRGPDRAKCSCGNDACESQAKHPRTASGLKDATTDPSAIEGWWRRWPNANVGVRTGVVFDACDIDGDDALDALEVAGPDGDDGLHGPIAVTGRGVHLLVGPTGEGNRAAFLPGVDWRGRDGFIVAPPSVHYLAGDEYSWGDGFGPDRPIPPCPTWLAELVRRPKVTAVHSLPEARHVEQGWHGHGDVARRRIDGAAGLVAMAREGERNHLLNWASHKLGSAVVAGELDLGDVVNALTLAAARCGLPERETALTIRSGLRAAGVGWAA
jgi:hypothetical protein